MFRFIKRCVLLARPWHVFQILGDQLVSRGTVEHSRLAAFMVGKIVPSLLVQILHIYRVTSRTNLYCRSSRNFRQARPRSDLGVGVVSELRGGIIHLAAYFLVLISPRSRDLLRSTVTFYRCFCELSGSFARNDEAR